MHHRLTLLTLASCLVLAAPAAAATYQGKAAGSDVTLTVSGKRVTKVDAAIPVVCVATSGTGGTRAGIERFTPSGPFTLGAGDQTVSELRRSAVVNRDVTMNQHFDGARRGRTISGKLSVNYSTSDFDVLTMTTTITVCDGSATFRAKRR
ncbi:MAG TPA: hypothetical protein VNZ62_12395 [Capillimicrobium sp.]|nr:hypothetical protein [Capillimicrobium sp.]